MMTDKFTAAYFQAIDFTETGDCEQPPSGTPLSPAYKAQAWGDCRNFLRAYGDLLKAAGVSHEQAGHDLWLTRNGHGTGFWDRPEIYGVQLSAELTRAAQAMGSTDAEFALDETETTQS